MNASTPSSAALSVLRAIFDLADADVHPTTDLLCRLVGLTPSQLAFGLSHLRHRGLLQEDRLGLTMLGLATALGLPEFQPQPVRCGAMMADFRYSVRPGASRRPLAAAGWR